MRNLLRRLFLRLVSVTKKRTTLTEFEQQKLAMSDPNRVVVIEPGRERYAAPPVVNAFFACHDINCILDGDRILYENDPPSGFVVVRGQKFDCAKELGNATKMEIGTIAPGETKTITVPLTLKAS